MSTMVGNDVEMDRSLLSGATSNSSKGKPKPARSSPRGRQHDFHHEWEKNRVRFGQSNYLSPRGSPNGKSRGTPSKSPRQSPSYTELYAGFSDSPAPAALPKPPSHWIPAVQEMKTGRSCHREAVRFAQNIKLLLNAQA